jgi:hypothetical protein
VNSVDSVNSVNRKTSLVLGFGAAIVIASGCTVVAPANPDAGMTTIIPIPIRPDALPPPKPLEASVLVVANLDRSAANLADHYSQVILGLGAYLGSVGLQIDNMGLIATYGDKYGPRLLLGRRADAPATPPLTDLIAAALASGTTVEDYDHLLPYVGTALGNVSDDDLPIALKLLASSGHFDGDGETSEAKNVIGFGRGLGGEDLPPALGGIERSALFDKPRDLFIVIYLQPLPRRCDLSSPACLVDGRTPTDIFMETDSEGNAAWLDFQGAGIKPGQLLHVAIATREQEDVKSFRTRCANVPGFPLTLFDVMAPSPNAYFTPLTTALNNAHRGTGTFGDFCELIGTDPAAAMMKLGNNVAGVLGAQH